MRRPRGLLPDEAELWGRVARTVRPLAGKKDPPRACSERGAVAEGDGGGAFNGGAIASPSVASRLPPPRDKLEQNLKKAQPRPLDRYGLDGSWERKLAKAEVSPDFTLDLHGHGLDAAYTRLDHGLAQAAALGARVVLVITGKPRPVDAADRGSRRGAIRAKLLDWLAHGSHASKIAAVRGAHRKHGGAGAVYVVLKRPK